MSNSILLHIGPPKTGSSFLQAKFFPEFFPRVKLVGPRAASALIGHVTDESAVIASFENWGGAVHPDEHQENFWRFLTLLEELDARATGRLAIAMVIRPYLDWVISAYKHCIKSYAQIWCMS